ncbi:hypothetical protein ASH02_23485 [Nocardioides sp. Soil796]|nr:hypothetical protein ASH02_23485 [Nocardioides sp. Soil796]
MTPRAALAVTLAVVVAALSAPAYADSDHASRVTQSHAKDDHGSKEEKALQALASATDALSGEGSQDASMALLEVQQTKADLPAAEQDRAEQLMLRPSDSGTAPAPEISYGTQTDEIDCTAHFCVHWVRTGKHMPDLTDSDNDEVPDYVELVESVMENVWAREVGDLRYRRPLSDGAKDNPVGEGRTGLLDVYLGDTGASQVYGYANIDEFTTRAAGFLVLDNDFADFSGDPTESLKVTAAHEFFHTVQFAYATNEDPWFMESTATFMEERVYDEINDNRQYLRYSSLARPAQSLDADGGAWYGNWIFFEHLGNRFGTDVVRQVWYRARTASVTSTGALDAELRARSTSLAAAFVRFSADNTMPDKAYEEGAAYPNTAIAGTWHLDTATRTTRWRTFWLKHLASRSYNITPGTGMGANWQVRIEITAPSYAARAHVVLHLTNGSVVQRPVALNSEGQATRRFVFDKNIVSRVTLTLANGSARYRCWSGTQFSCEGTPLDEGRGFKYRATSQRG